MKKIIIRTIALLVLPMLVFTSCARKGAGDVSDNAVVFVLLGQSNATGHALPMAEEDKITTPLTHVFGLSREHNQSFEGEALVWEGYTSGGMNLGETQDHTYSLANCLAAKWQAEIDNGRNLPELYIVHIAVGAEGVTRYNMWNPGYEKKLIPGELGTVDIALYPLTVHILSMLDGSFREMGKNYEILLHWRGGENDVGNFIARKLQSIYEEIFAGFDAVVTPEMEIVMHRVVCHDRMNDLDPTGQSEDLMHIMNDVFDTLAEDSENITVYDITKEYPGYIPDVRGNGIFKEDMVHYTKEVNQFVAEQIIDDYVQGRSQ